MSVLVIGVGNPDRGDDGAGREVVNRLRRIAPEGTEFVELSGEAAGLLALFETASAAVIIDASRSGAPAGAIRRFDAAAEPLPGGFLAFSSHGFGPAAAIELARTLGVLPPKCVVFAVEGERFDIGAPITQAVSVALDDVVERISRELSVADD
ncbi:hydrogenase maturation protease [Methylocystis parvus]|uniref:Hydrogenase maturation protease n=1 Tax=Methylocystis parvus TaxID=134 RepID=A0A6B8M241_9HYPH|nr:hydrogenase maturation protease [Methylocystis parvus]QGM96352.1 hydrogenase maturation protease [Methylocystis parvus]WBJ99810.1 hydrogenase maturation protease [Methylocystis parvus OBBP]